MNLLPISSRVELKSKEGYFAGQVLLSFTFQSIKPQASFNVAPITNPTTNQVVVPTVAPFTSVSSSNMVQNVAVPNATQTAVPNQSIESGNNTAQILEPPSSLYMPSSAHQTLNEPQNNISRPHSAASSEHNSTNNAMLPEPQSNLRPSSPNYYGSQPVSPPVSSIYQPTGYVATPAAAFPVQSYPTNPTPPPQAYSPPLQTAYSPSAYPPAPQAQPYMPYPAQAYHTYSNPQQATSSPSYVPYPAGSPFQNSNQPGTYVPYPSGTPTPNYYQQPYVPYPSNQQQQPPILHNTAYDPNYRPPPPPSY